MDKLTDWLMEGDPWIQHATQIRLLGAAPESRPSCQLKSLAIVEPQVRTLLKEVRDWPWLPLTRHNDAKHPIHKLAFLASIGLSYRDLDIQETVDHLLANQSLDGAFCIPLQTYERFGGSGQPEMGWMLCDGPLIAATFCELGLGQDPRVRRAMEHYVSLVRDNGWPCAVDPAMGRFRGPGSRSDPCPYATLLMLRLLSAAGELDHPAAYIGVETLLGLWTQRQERRPYLFAMGTHFSRLKAPLIWYDIVHVMDVLSHFVWAHDDARFQEMLALVTSKADGAGRFRPESVWMAWKEWDFGQKRESSRGLTLIIQTLLARIEKD